MKREGLKRLEDLWQTIKIGTWKKSLNTWEKQGSASKQLFLISGIRDCKNSLEDNILCLRITKVSDQRSLQVNWELNIEREKFANEWISSIWMSFLEIPIFVEVN